MRGIEARLGKVEARQEMERQALAQDARGHEHLDRDQVIAAIRSQVADMLAFRTMAQLRDLFRTGRHSRLVLEVLDILEQGVIGNATH